MLYTSLCTFLESCLYSTTKLQMHFNTISQSIFKKNLKLQNIRHLILLIQQEKIIITLPLHWFKTNCNASLCAIMPTPCHAKHWLDNDGNQRSCQEHKQIWDKASDVVVFKEMELAHSQLHHVPLFTNKRFHPARIFITSSGYSVYHVNILKTFWI